MIWRAYAALSGAIVLSVVVLAMTMGMPEKWIMQLAVGTSAVMLANAMFVTLCVAAFRRRKR
jgi:F0F1-type ATP synthase assembly protein I